MMTVKLIDKRLRFFQFNRFCNQLHNSYFPYLNPKLPQ
jgi:hypothetical protein